MKNFLLLLSVLIAAPAWAEEAAPASASQTAVTVQLTGSAKGVRAMLAGLEKDAVYKDAGCSAKSMKKSAKTAKISCANAGGALLDYLGKNTPDKVRWSISSAVATRAALACAIQTCNNLRGCYFPRCGGICNTCP